MRRLDGYRNFCNKLWNASRYVLMNTEEHDCGLDGNDIELSLADQWIIERSNQAVADFRKALEQYRFDQAASIAYEFTWNQFCDWYLELTKPVLFNGTEAQQRGTRRTLVQTLEKLLRMLHPILPYITEAIWQRVAPVAGIDTSVRKSIMVEAFPQVLAEQYPTAMADLEWLKEVIEGIRNIRGEMDISPNKALPLLIQHADDTAQRRLTDNAAFLKALAKLESIEFLSADEEGPASATALVGKLELHIPMAGLIDKDAELGRLDKAIEKAQGEIKRVQGKLSNDSFVSKAPAAVIDKERAKLAEQEETLQTLTQQRAKIAAM